MTYGSLLRLTDAMENKNLGIPIVLSFMDEEVTNLIVNDKFAQSATPELPSRI